MNVDLTPVVEAMARGHIEHPDHGGPGSFEQLDPIQQQGVRQVMLDFLLPALPVLHAQVAAALVVEREATAPWPIVAECSSDHRSDHRCPQCDGSHEHRWVAWRDAPQTSPGSGTRVVGGQSGPGVPVRCAVCGGRKCDHGACRLRRHHRETEHEEF